MICIENQWLSMIFMDYGLVPLAQQIIDTEAGAPGVCLCVGALARPKILSCTQNNNELKKSTSNWPNAQPQCLLRLGSAFANTNAI